MTATNYDVFRPPGTPVPLNGDRRDLVTPVLMTVTPDQAREWTARNTSNRSVRYGLVAQFARDMKAGNWDVNGETVKIADDGGLLDGQHRLYACIEAGVPFETFVVTGLPRSTQRTMDAGARRKLSDHLALAGEKNTILLAAIARWALLWTRGTRGRTSGDLEPTHPELLEFIAAAGPALRAATEFAMQARADIKSIRPSVFGMAYLIFNEKNDIAARVFLERVRDGADIGVGHPAHTLRAKIYRAKENDERLTEQEQLALFILAWNYFRDEKKVTLLKLPPGGLNSKSFPEPK